MQRVEVKCTLKSDSTDDENSDVCMHTISQYRISILEKRDYYFLNSYCFVNSRKSSCFYDRENKYMQRSKC